MTGGILQVDLDAPASVPFMFPPGAVFYLVYRRGGRVVGRQVVEGPAIVPRPDLPVAAWESEPMPASAPAASDVSVVVATRNRPAELGECLAALRALSPPPGEIVVVDSASEVPVAGATVRLEKPGLSLARNAGAHAARGSIVAFLDDDCRVEPSWLDGIRRGFADERVHAVTGSFLPAELDHEAQVLFLRYAHMDRRGFEPHRFTLAQRESRHWPLDAWRMGSGGNFAVRADVFRRLGGFRLDLGLGTPSAGGEDLFLLWSIVHAGWDVVYRPDAMAWHRHHRDLASLHRVMAGYGSGHTAFLHAARGAGASFGDSTFYALSVLYDRAKRALGAAARFDGARLGLVMRETVGMFR